MVRMASRQGLEGLRCDANMGPTSDTQNSSTPEIRIKTLVISSRVIRDKELNTLSQMFTFTHISLQLV